MIFIDSIYLISDYTIGFCACFIVVLVVSVLLTIINDSPLIFLRLAELQNGEIDLELTASSSELQLLNYSLLDEYLSTDEQYSYSSPRWLSAVGITTCDGLDPSLNPYDVDWKYNGVDPGDQCKEYGTCFFEYCNDAMFSGYLYLIDSERESRMELGRNWNYPPVPPGRAYIDSTLSGSLGKQKGDTIYVYISGVSFYGALWDDIVSQNETGNVTALALDFIYLPVVIEDVYSSPEGKYPNSISSVLIMEYSTFQGYLGQNINPDMDLTSQEELMTLDLYQFAQYVAINLPPPRIDLYLSSNYDTIQKQVVSYMSDVMYKVGFDETNTTLPVLQGVQNNQIYSLFLGLVFNLAVVILLLLSILLIYSLLMINVETRKFEMGVLRLLGTWRSGIIQLLLFQAFSYAIPSWVLGLASGGLLSFFVVWIFHQ